MFRADTMIRCMVKEMILTEYLGMQSKNDKPIEHKKSLVFFTSMLPSAFSTSATGQDSINCTHPR